ncbi:hypothetical protein GTA62_19710 [Roseobacter sp. HKCCD9010]|uniref:hypothetical protein n=1 Tax=unclassified Roseobacter TaxID=196798 RepID=UPI001492F2F4|nr:MULTISPECIES: hypothetical protein [unclassified Roseobacter]MBF9052191.1 hypothetical protein [Rhodobacterales bacterium HKCCD4356]NNV40597.1 hypothetical protein [Roseobacter sp. HKCCD9054]NNV78916.1 hypothetical protein [Roseobacter sp. HKCCD6135]NNY04667.1 hypothetical protein [Roseobacter sp. HKCCD7635]NPT91641.1 hypothetical protein [Roseobacter sp. HKCCD6571]
MLEFDKLELPTIPKIGSRPISGQRITEPEMIGDTGKSTKFFRIGLQGLVSRAAFIASGAAGGSKI